MKKRSEKIIIIPYAWLGNRIRTIASAHAFAKTYNRKLKILWVNHDNGMVLPFSEIFDQPEDFEVVELKSKFAGLMLQSTGKLFKLLRLKKIKSINRYTLFTDLDKISDDIANDSNNLLVRTCHRIYPSQCIPLSFKSSIKFAGDQFLKSISGNFVGMHIRRGDHPAAIQHSPTELFINVAKKEIFQNNKKILLCTDDAGVKKTFKNTFGENVYTREVNLDHSSTAHIKDAAIDMYCLSKAQKIYGSHFSSFSGISSEFNNTPLEILKIG